MQKWWWAGVAVAALAVMIVLLARQPVCGPDSPHGPRLGGVILLQGCP